MVSLDQPAGDYCLSMDYYMTESERLYVTRSHNYTAVDSQNIWPYYENEDLMIDARDVQTYQWNNVAVDVQVLENEGVSIGLSFIIFIVLYYHFIILYHYLDILYCYVIILFIPVYFVCLLVSIFLSDFVIVTIL